MFLAHGAGEGGEDDPATAQGQRTTPPSNCRHPLSARKTSLAYLRVRVRAVKRHRWWASRWCSCLPWTLLAWSHAGGVAPSEHNTIGEAPPHHHHHPPRFPLKKEGRRALGTARIDHRYALRIRSTGRCTGKAWLKRGGCCTPSAQPRHWLKRGCTVRPVPRGVWGPEEIIADPLQQVDDLVRWCATDTQGRAGGRACCFGSTLQCYPSAPCHRTHGPCRGRTYAAMPLHVHRHAAGGTPTRARAPAPRRHAGRNVWHHACALCGVQSGAQKRHAKRGGTGSRR